MRQTLFFGLAVWVFAACNSTPTPETAVGAASPAFSSPLLPYFPDLGPGDTLFVANDQSILYGDTIPNELLWAELDSVLLAQIAYGPDLGSLVAVARGYWPEDSLHRACLMQVEQYWWKFQYALIFDLDKDAFSGVQPLSEFYGGDGGQIATVSWVFDRDGDGDRDIVTRSSEHFLEMLNMDEGEVKEHTTEEVYLWDWNGSGFEPVSKVDSAALVRAFPVEWGW